MPKTLPDPCITLGLQLRCRSTARSERVVAFARPRFVAWCACGFNCEPCRPILRHPLHSHQHIDRTSKHTVRRQGYEATESWVFAPCGAPHCSGNCNRLLNRWFGGVHISDSDDISLCSCRVPRLYVLSPGSSGSDIIVRVAEGYG